MLSFGFPFLACAYYVMFCVTLYNYYLALHYAGFHYYLLLVMLFVPFKFISWYSMIRLSTIILYFLCSVFTLCPIPLLFDVAFNYYLILLMFCLIACLIQLLAFLSLCFQLLSYIPMFCFLCLIKLLIGFIIKLSAIIKYFLCFVLTLTSYTF